MNYLGFISTELFILGFVFIAIYGVTLGIAAFFQCDFECKPDVATISHNIHMASAFPGYLCGIIAMFCISSGSMPWSKSKVFKFGGYVLAILALFAFLNLDRSSITVGLNQRIVELSMYFWLIFLGYSLSKYLSNKQINKD